MKAALTTAFASFLLLTGCSSGGDSSASYVPPPPGAVMTTEANLSWTLTWTFENPPSGKQCLLTLTVHNTGDLASKPVSGLARSQWSTRPGVAPWSASTDLIWEETGSSISVVPGHSGLTARYRFSADSDGNFVASMWVNAFGWITHEKDEGGGQWSQQFIPGANG